MAFDDVARSAVPAAGMLAERGHRATLYVSAGRLGGMEPHGPLASDAEVRALGRAGHELAGHTHSHLACGAADAATLGADVERNRRWLADAQYEPVSFAYPFGDCSPAAKRVLAPRFATLRGVRPGLVRAGSDANLLPACPLTERSAPGMVGWLDRAQRRPAWLLVVLHDVRPNPSPWGCSPGTLGRLLDAAERRGFEVITAREAAARLGLRSPR